MFFEQPFDVISFQSTISRCTNTFPSALVSVDVSEIGISATLSCKKS